MIVVILMLIYSGLWDLFWGCCWCWVWVGVGVLFVVCLVVGVVDCGVVFGWLDCVEVMGLVEVILVGCCLGILDFGVWLVEFGVGFVVVCSW